MSHDWRELRIANVGKTVTVGGSRAVLVEDVTLTVRRGAFVCLLGPSGCGKTTLLNMIAGFDEPTAGGVFYDDRPITGPGLDRVVLFQDVSSALFPWLDVAGNVAFGLDMKGVPRDRQRVIVEQQLSVVGLGRDAGKYPYQLSGGMKQRVQLARALAVDPEILLMDEPFAALDAINKRILQQELSQLWKRTGKTVVYVTHDILEALQLATDIAVMTAGPAARIREVMTPAAPPPRRPGDAVFVELLDRIETVLHEEVMRARHA